MSAESLKFDGRFRDGVTAREVPVGIERDGEDLVITAGEKVLRVALATVVADAPLPGVARLLALPDGGQIETDDREAAAARPI